MHSRLNWWTERSIEWFNRASIHSDYHERLADCIIPLLSGCRSVLEFGCGLGYEAEILAGRGFEVTAIDRDPSVIRSAKERTGLDIFRCSDAASDTDSHADALLCINYGHLDTPEQLKGLLSHADDRLVYVISRHNGHGTDTREDRTDHVRNLLKETGLPFTETPLTLDFDQPLESVEDARDFVEFTYLGKHTERYMEFVEGSDDRMYPFVFRNRKNLTVFAVGKWRLK